MIISNQNPHKQIELPDGRLLAFTEYGDPNGAPVFFFHGWPGARLQGRLAEDPALKLGIRYIAVDRPGFGLSDFQWKRKILDWPGDVLGIADILDMDKFGVIGLSGGAPYALACAHQIPHRLSATGIISGLGPSAIPNAAKRISTENRTLFLLSRLAPWSLTFILRRRVEKRAIDPERSFSELLVTLPEVDQQALDLVRQFAIDASSDSFRHGVNGHAWELRLFSRSWGFRRREIDVPVHFWHGEADVNIFASTTREQSAAIPNSTAQYLPGEGHYSTYINHIGEILKELV